MRVYDSTFGFPLKSSRSITVNTVGSWGPHSIITGITRHKCKQEKFSGTQELDKNFSQSVLCHYLHPSLLQKKHLVILYMPIMPGNHHLSKKQQRNMNQLLFIRYCSG